jgi:hypothetical protein
MKVTKKAMPRRTFLRGVGVTLALPLLEPDTGGDPLAKTAPTRPPPGFRFMPMGCDITAGLLPAEPLTKLSPSSALWLR